jgi:hypothetical protein
MQQLLPMLTLKAPISGKSEIGGDLFPHLAGKKDRLWPRATIAPGFRQWEGIT